MMYYRVESDRLNRNTSARLTGIVGATVWKDSGWSNSRGPRNSTIHLPNYPGTTDSDWELERSPFAPQAGFRRKPIRLQDKDKIKDKYKDQVVDADAAVLEPEETLGPERRRLGGAGHRCR